MSATHMGRYLAKGISELQEQDPQLFAILEREHVRQSESLSLIASSGGTDPSVLVASASTMVNVTAEGYPGKRYHAGCTYVDQAETLAIERAKSVFGARYVNVQPHCASFANHAVMQAVLSPGDTILGMALDQGGHLTHGSAANLSGRLFRSIGYGLDANGFIDYDGIRRLALENRPRLIICGTTSYTRTIDFDRIRRIADEVDALVLADITHIAGLVVAGLHPSSIDAAHFTTTCTFKQLFGPRGGLVLMGRDADSPWTEGRTFSECVQASVFPLMQGSPEVHSIAAKARAMGRLLEPGFRDIARRIRSNAGVLADDLQARGYQLVGGGTDNHLVLFHAPNDLTGDMASRALESCNILVNKNKIPGDRRGATVASGIRLGTNTVSLRGMQAAEMLRCSSLIDDVLSHARPLNGGEVYLSEDLRDRVVSEVSSLCRAFPMPYDVTQDVTA
ncbi:serine hydroxymethyltransferase [Luteibacter sp. ME-Dv--P-043b]|uniref:serine hydroxymethyltransferase n=1 Tax=Luteibacter sp. ME-Dv--P-043b TaxID=3040291 RepID=UPI002556E8B9|nr:serine hydroxymethyltransferase [Luteibacter sp. ME-Dv--P-043b]